jgi:hypothetical protein
MASQRREIVLVRSLTSSDLGIFAAHRPSASSKQRAININAQLAEIMLSPAAYRAGKVVLDCLCKFGNVTDRSHRSFGKVHKNWRLGGNKLRGAEFAQIDSVDFLLLRSVERNDGTEPVAMTFIARSADARSHAELVKIVSSRLKRSMTVFMESETDFADVASLCPARPVVFAVSSKGSPIVSRRAKVLSIDEPVPPMPDISRRETRPRTIKEKLHSTHIVGQMLKVSGDMSAPAQLLFLETVEQLAEQLRKVLLRSGKIIKIERDHRSLWKSVAGHKIGFVDGGMANLSMLGAVPVAVRVGGYVVTPGDRSEQRESFVVLKKLIAELYASSVGGVYDGSFPDVGALRDAARISIEAAGGVKLLADNSSLSWLFLHGALVNPVSRYTDVMKDRQVRYKFPDFSTGALVDLLPPGEANRTGRDANFVSVYLKQLELLRASNAVVCGVVERESHTTSVIKQIISDLDDHVISSLLPLPPDEWRHWFLTAVDPADEDEGQGQRITDPLLFRCVLEPGEALLPVRVDRNELRRAPDAWKQEIAQYPAPFVSYIQPTEWNAPIRIELFEKDLSRFEETASLVMHSSLLLPKYAFPVGLDIVDKFAKIPNWMSRPVNTHTAVQTLKRALDRGDTKLFDAMRRLMCGSQREWLLRPGVFK